MSETTGDAAPADVTILTEAGALVLDPAPGSRRTPTSYAVSVSGQAGEPASFREVHDATTFHATFHTPVARRPFSPVRRG